MVIDPERPQDEYWFTDDGDGSAVTWTFTGEDGLQRLGGAADYTTAVPSRFEARLMRLQLDHIAVEGFVSTAHRMTRTAEHAARDITRAITFVFPIEGDLRVELAGGAFDLRPGEYAVLDSRDPVTISTTTSSRSMLSTIGLDHVPAHLLERGTTIAAAVRRTPLVDSFVAFQASMLAAGLRGTKAQGDHLIRALADLHSAVLAEAQQITGEPTGTAGLRYRMEEYIEAHLADRDLGPEGIAEALGISLRHAHNVFNDGERTIGRFIRERRVEAVALTLRTSDGRIPLDELARRHGFATHTAMTRLFRERYGMTTTEYRAHGHRARG